MKLILGNSLEKLKELEDNSIDSIVTDPPYELGFMGKKWDNTGIANNVDLWAECLRVLKPGGHLLAFSGTRTYHRMAVAIEDAGFEVRDMIEWVYGSGFPKSLNIGKAVDKLQGNEREVIGVSEGKGYSSIQEKNIEQDNRPYVDGLPYLKADRTLTKGTSEWEGWGTALKPAHEPICMARKPKEEYPPVLDVCCGPRMMWFDKTDARAIYQDKRDVEIKTNPNKAYKNGKIFVIKPDVKGDFSSMDFSDNTFKHVVFDPPHFLETDPNSKMLMRVQYGQLESNWKEVIRKGFAECFRVLQNGGTLVFKWCEYDVPVSDILELTPVKPLYGHRSGKQSKTHWLVFIKEEEQQQNTTPEHSPICMARKPLAEKNVAQNVLKWGTGGINIDESRVEADKNDKFGGGGLNSPVNGFMGNTESTYKKGTGFRDDTHLGRFPANLIHDNSDEVRECFPETKSTPSPGHFRKGNVVGDNRTSKAAGQFGDGNWIEGSKHNDSGSASRFFKSIIYNPKASKAERNKGCEGLEEKQYSHDGREKEIENAFQRNKSVATNNHPTVKPIALMEYLIKMVTPKGGTVLDPFMGSGSTGVAAKKNGYDFIGIDMTPEYIEIAKARINATEIENRLL